MYENGIFLHIKYHYYRGSLCSGIRQFPTLFFFLLADQQGAPWPPCSPLSYASGAFVGKDMTPPAGAYAGGGGGGSGGSNPPFEIGFFFFFFFFFFACHPGGRSGRRTVPLPNNVNDAKQKNVSESPPLISFFRPGMVKTTPLNKSCVRY